jgi:hypothetical protein
MASASCSKLRDSSTTSSATLAAAWRRLLVLLLLLLGGLADDLLCAGSKVARHCWYRYGTIAA